MNHSLIGAGVAAVLTLTGLPAYAGCADPRAASSEARATPEAEAQGGSPLTLSESTDESNWAKASARERIVGTWYVKYTAGGAPFAQAFIQWHDDGTEWESINMPTLSGTVCLGSWKAIDSMHVSRFHVGWLYDNGVLSGHFSELETNEVSWDGKFYKGTNVTKVYDLTDKLLVEVPGTSFARRIPPP